VEDCLADVTVPLPFSVVVVWGKWGDVWGDRGYGEFVAFGEFVGTCCCIINVSWFEAERETGGVAVTNGRLTGPVSSCWLAVIWDINKCRGFRTSNHGNVVFFERGMVALWPQYFLKKIIDIHLAPLAS
jgi:hypothetical protein